MPALAPYEMTAFEIGEAPSVRDLGQLAILPRLGPARPRGMGSVLDDIAANLAAALPTAGENAGAVASTLAGIEAPSATPDASLPDISLPNVSTPSFGGSVGSSGTVTAATAAGSAAGSAGGSFAGGILTGFGDILKGAAAAAGQVAPIADAFGQNKAAQQNRQLQAAAIQERAIESQISADELKTALPYVAAAVIVPTLAVIAWRALSRRRSGR